MVVPELYLLVQRMSVSGELGQYLCSQDGSYGALSLVEKEILHAPRKYHVFLSYLSNIGLKHSVLYPLYVNKMKS